MLKNKRITIILTIFLTILLFIVGCSDKNKEVKEKQPKSVTEETSTERKMVDAMGHEVLISAHPERIIASYLEDNLVALGIMPVAQWSINDGEGVQQYLQDYLKDVPTIPSDLPFEVVTSFMPDLILMGSAEIVEGAKYEQYNKIAPTFVVEEENNGDWREQLRSVGEIVGQKEKADKVLADYETKAKESKKLIQDSVGTDSVAAIWLVNNNFYMVSDNVSSGAVLYGDLGLATPNLVKEITDTATGNWSAISLESLAELDADHLFLINSDIGNGAEMLKDPVWKSIPAVKKGQIYEFSSDTSWLYAGPIANTQMIDDVIASLTK